jgi:two-component system, chemotaxis family, protein-glutamate methylesterase/glutaminase
VELVEARPENKGEAVMTQQREEQPAVIQHDMTSQPHNQRSDQLSVYTCPDCGGAIWQIQDGPMAHYECHIGHRYSPDVFLLQKTEDLEAALWAAIRLLKEKSLLTAQSAARLQAAGNAALAERLHEEAARDEQYLHTLRAQILLAPTGPTAQGFSLAQVLQDLYERPHVAGQDGDATSE